MVRHNEIHQNCLSKSHIFSFQKTKPVFKPLPVPIGVKNKEVTVNYKNSYFEKSMSISHTLLIPSRVPFMWLITNEGVQLTFNSKQGNIQILIPKHFDCVVQDRIINFHFTDSSLKAEFKTLIGAIYRAMLGVTKGYQEKLKTVGVGYKAGFTNNHLINMMLGYSHPVYYFLNPATKIRFSRKFNRLNIKGPNSSIVNQSAADLYLLKRPDVYKGKGIRYRGYKLLKKEGKKKK